MKPKTLVLVVALLAVLSGVVYFIQRPAPPAAADARLGRSLADPAALEKGAYLKLSDQGKSVSLAKGADGTWRVSNYYDLPVDASKLARFVGDLTDAKIQRLTTTSADRIARLEFKDTQITFSDAADKEVWSATLGKTAETGGRFVRFGTEQKAYLANLNAWLDMEPKNWADSQVNNLKADEIAKVELSFPGDQAATVTATRAKKEDPFVAEKAPEGKKLKAESVTSILSSFGNLRFSDTTELTDPKAVAAKAHTRTLKLTTFDGKTTVLTLGRKPEEKIVKAPAPKPNAAGPASVLPAPSPEAKPPGESGGPAQAIDASTETIPAGPVYVAISYPDAKAPAADLMQKRAVSVSDYVFTSLPQKPEEMFEATSPAAPAPTPPPASPAEPAKQP